MNEAGGRRLAAGGSQTSPCRAAPIDTTTTPPPASSLQLPARVVLALAFALATLSAGEVRVDASCPWEDKDGYTPVLVRVEALIAPVEVELEAHLGGASATGRLRVEPGRPGNLTLLLPSHNGYGTPELRWSTPNDRDSTSVRVDIDYRAAALVVLDPLEQVPLPALLKLVEAQAPDSSHGGRSGYRSSSGDRVRRLAPDLLPERWQGLPAWLTLLTTAAGEAQLGQGQREAIAGWTRLGGALFTSDPAAVAAWARLGAHATLCDPTAADQPALIGRLKRVAGEDGRPGKHPVPGTASVPTAWFLSLAIAFAIVAGPLNIWWAVRRRQPWLLLVSTPLISLGTCVLLIAIALASDGIGRRRSAVQVTLCDQGRAAVFTGSTWFCGIAPGAFALDPEDRLVPMDEADFNGGWRSNNRPDLALDWTSGQSALAGWIPARINRQLACTQVRPERRRLSLVRNGDGWRVGNGFDITIRSLHWRDAAGMPWQVADLRPGQEAVLTRAQAGPPPLAEPLSRLGLDARLALAGATTAPRWWLARLDGPLQALPGPTAIDAEPVEVWAVGLLDETSAKTDGGF